MTDKEREELLQYMEDFIQKAKVDKELRKQFLIEAGIYDQEGKFTEPYSHLGTAIRINREIELMQS